MTLIKSTSMRTSYRRCPRLIYFRYVAGIKVKEKIGPRTIGSAYHLGLQHMRTSRSWQKGVEIAETVFNDGDGYRFAVEKIKVGSYIRGYWDKFSYDFNYREILTEKMVGTDNEVCYIDAALVCDDGSIKIIEDKTTSTFADEIDQSFSMNEQLLNYVYLCRLNGINIQTMKYREILKSVHKVNKKETIDEFKNRIDSLYLTEDQRYREFEFMPEEEDLKRYVIDKTITDIEIDRLIDTMVEKPVYEWPCYGFSCIGKYGACEYLPICSRRIEWYRDTYEANGKEPLDGYRFQKTHSLLDSPVSDNPFIEKSEVEND